MIRELIHIWWRFWLAICCAGWGVGMLLGAAARLGPVENYVIILGCANALVGGYFMVLWYPRRFRRVRDRNEKPGATEGSEDLQ